MKRHEIRALTGVRGIAAMLVAVYHLNGPHVPLPMRLPGAAGTLVGHGYLAVDLFFVLSGYVMALSYGNMVRRFAWPPYCKFLIRRIARVYPLFIVLTAIIALGLFTGISHEPQPGRLGPAFLLNALMLQSWFGSGWSLDVPAWSISAEWAAYVVFPLLATFALFGTRRTAVLLFLVAIASVVAIATIPAIELRRTGPLDIYVPGPTLVRCLAEFSLGLLTYRASGNAAVCAAVERWWVGLLLAAGIIGFMAAGDYDLAVVALFPPLVLALAVGKGPVQRFCALPPIFLLGELSYAIYLLHSRFIRVRDVLEAKLHPLASAAAPVIANLLVYALIVAVAWVLYSGLERPARAWVRKAERLIPQRLPTPDRKAPDLQAPAGRP
ncbi:MAG: acyltransferase family protein [Acetobacteraceae bacterium]